MNLDLKRTLSRHRSSTGRSSVKAIHLLGDKTDLEYPLGEPSLCSFKLSKKTKAYPPKPSNSGLVDTYARNSKFVSLASSDVSANRSL